MGIHGRISRLERDLKAEKVIQKEETRKVFDEVRGRGDDGRNVYEDAVYEVVKPRITEPDKLKRNTAKRELQRIYDDCKAGKLMCGEDKKHCAELMTKFMDNFVKGIEKARKQVDKLTFIK